MNALELRNVTKEYPGFSLKDIRFSLPSGYIMGLIGENGAGKTTTLKAILGLIHSQGEIQVLGKGREAITATKEQVGVVLEDATFPDPLSGRDVARILKGVYKTWDESKFTALLRQFDLDPKKKVKDYSRGMKMKLSLAVALSHDSRLLLLDEPTSGLDPVVREEVLDMLLQFIQEPDRSVLFSSHILSDLERVCDYVTFLHQGKVFFSMSKEALEETYGIYRCGREELSRLPQQAIAGLRENQFGCEALLLRGQVPGLALERAGIEEIMVLLIKGVR